MNRGIELLCESYHCQYIPQMKAQQLYDAGWLVRAEDVAVCNAGPSNVNYWETWRYILDNATFKDKDGNVWRLYQYGDLWAYCDQLMTDEEKETLFG